jgi:hypothetical protein
MRFKDTGRDVRMSFQNNHNMARRRSFELSYSYTRNLAEERPYLQEEIPSRKISGPILNPITHLKPRQSILPGKREEVRYWSPLPRGNRLNKSPGANHLTLAHQLIEHPMSWCEHEDLSGRSQSLTVRRDIVRNLSLYLKEECGCQDVPEFNNLRQALDFPAFPPTERQRFINLLQQCVGPHWMVIDEPWDQPLSYVGF